MRKPPIGAQNLFATYKSSVNSLLAGLPYPAVARDTVVALAVDKTGSVVEVKVLKSSGDSEIDQKIAGLINSASPLPGPPEGCPCPVAFSLTVPASSYDPISKPPLDQTFALPKGKPLLFKTIELGIPLKAFTLSEFPGGRLGQESLVGSSAEDAPETLRKERDLMSTDYGKSLEVFSWRDKKTNELLPVTIAGVPAQASFYFINVAGEPRLVRILLRGQYDLFPTVQRALEERYGGAEQKLLNRHEERYVWTNSASKLTLARQSLGLRPSFAVDYQLTSNSEPAQKIEKFSPVRTTDL